ncbi:MAG: M14 family metallopeptidase, partial [bacterium]|nr:M14 family metallopeptidase [bacterium]
MTRPGSTCRPTVLVLAILLMPAASALTAEPPLPPAPPWDGASRALVVEDDDPWITPAEASGLRRTPDYETTFAWLRRLVATSPELAMISFGKSGEGRDLWLVVASADRVFTPAGLRRTGKPIVLVQAGIHSGEIDGKDAGMMLLRDMTVRGTKRSVLEAVQWLFVPILSVDGHERSSPYSRINQRGPEEAGWRTNARNLNLNRDYCKADTPEIQAMLGLLNTWGPDLYVDVHVTDGIDYQYDVTWGANGFSGYSPSIAKWLDS